VDGFGRVAHLLLKVTIGGMAWKCRETSRTNIVSKGSITIDGNQPYRCPPAKTTSREIAVITLHHTHTRRFAIAPGDLVNLEGDVLGNT